jgi:hypothetical protein
MKDTWIKIYRKASTHRIMRDPVAWTLFSYLLMMVDRETGSYTTGRIYLAEILGLPQSTIRNALHRLEKKYLVITTNRTTKYTEIIVSNWAKYQQDNIHEDNGRTTGGQREDTKQEERIKNTFTNVKVPVIEKLEEIKPKPPPLQSHPYAEIIEYCRIKQGMANKFVNYVKQTVACKRILASGYTLDDMRFVIDEMAVETYWKENPFDLMNVANNMHKYMNREIVFKKGDLKGKYAYN